MRRMVLLAHDLHSRSPDFSLLLPLRPIYCEIGLHAGHSTVAMLPANPSLQMSIILTYSPGHGQTLSASCSARHLATAWFGIRVIRVRQCLSGHRDSLPMVPSVTSCLLMGYIPKK